MNPDSIIEKNLQHKSKFSRPHFVQSVFLPLLLLDRKWCSHHNRT